jgi:hypothetical protein
LDSCASATDPDVSSREREDVDRLLKGWSELEEAELRESNSIYKGTARAIEALEGKVDSPAFDQPFKTLTQNSAYQEARTAFASRIRKLDEQLSLG